jgi:hypothetical protein
MIFTFSFLAADAHCIKVATIAIVTAESFMVLVIDFSVGQIMSTSKQRNFQTQRSFPGFIYVTGNYRLFKLSITTQYPVFFITK